MAGMGEQNTLKTVFSIENLQLAAHPGDEAYFKAMAEALSIKYAKASFASESRGT